MNKQKSNECFLISGMSGSIGGALAKTLIARDSNVIGLSRKTVNKDLRSKYPTVTWLEYDLSREEPNLETLSRLRDLIGEKHLQAVFHCSGVHFKGNAMEVSQNDYLDSFKGNLISTVNIVKLALDLILPGGSMLILNSQASIAPGVDEISYGVSKRALSAYVEGMQIEATKRKVQLVNVLPGAVKSSMAKNRDGYDNFIDAAELAHVLINLSEVGSSIRIKDVEILRRNY